MSQKFLKAATEMLSRTGKPMHYETITTLALKLRILVSNSRTPEVTMSTTLSREAANYPQSAIKKVRRGVYELLPRALANTEIGDFRCLGGRVNRLISELRCNNEITVLRRALHILRQCMSISYPSHTFTIGDGITEFDLDLLDPISIRKLRDELVGPQNRHSYTFRANGVLIQAAEELRGRLRLNDIESVVDLAISIAEIASCAQSDGFIIVTGQFDSVMIRVARST